MGNSMAIPLRILVDRENKKVVFAEADNDFADILFSFLTMPMGTIVRLLAKHSNSQPQAIGSLSTLYEGVANLQTKYFWTVEGKDMLLNPRNSSESECCKLKLNIDDTEPIKYFICEDWRCSRHSSSDLSTYNTVRCKCGKLMNREIGLSNSNVSAGNGKAGVFATETTSFIISDDLRIMPNLPSSITGLLNDLGIRDTNSLEEKILNFGCKEILDLLKLSLFSRSTLTDMFFGKKPIISDTVKSQSGKETNTDAKKMKVKVMVQKSNNKALFAQAEEDFIDFLFSFLTIPLGRVVSLLGGNTSMGSIDNLYKSTSSLNNGRYMKPQDWKDVLLYPQLAPQYLCKNHIFALSEAITPQFYCYSSYKSGHCSGNLTMFHPQIYYLGEVYSQMNFRNPKGRGGFVKGPTMFMVTDDLVVSPLSTISSISFLNRSKIPSSDVEEQVVNIGIEEALSILKASLNSTSALTVGLNLVLKKQKARNLTFLRFT